MKNLFKKIGKLLKDDKSKEWSMDFYYIVRDKKTGCLFYKRFITPIWQDCYKFNEQFRKEVDEGFECVGAILNRFSGHPVEENQFKDLIQLSFEKQVK